jgi:hypothetical protein
MRTAPVAASFLRQVQSTRACNAGTLASQIYQGGANVGSLRHTKQGALR